MEHQKARWPPATLPETIIAPENRPSQKETNIPTMLVSGSVVCQRVSGFRFSRLAEWKSVLLESTSIVDKKG